MEYPYDWNKIPSFGEHDFKGFYEHIVTQAPPNSKIVEVGCFHGRSLVQLGLCAKAADKGLKIYGFDHCKDQSARLAPTVMTYLAEAALFQVVEFKELTSVEAAREFQNNSLWFVFLDAAHDHDAVAEDIDAWMPKVNIKGYLGGHDARWHTVWQPVRAKLGNVIHDPHWDNCWWTNKLPPLSNDEVDIRATPVDRTFTYGYGSGDYRSDGNPGIVLDRIKPMGVL